MLTVDEAPAPVYLPVVSAPVEAADDLSAEELALEWDREWEAVKRRAGFRLVHGGLAE